MIATAHSKSLWKTTAWENNFRHLTWYFPTVFFMHFICQNFALRAAPVWIYVYIPAPHFHVYMYAWKRSQVVWLCVEGSGQISFQLECYYAFGASINVTVRNHHWGNFSKHEAQADGWGTAKNRGTRGEGQSMGKAILSENNTTATNTMMLLFQYICYFR